MFFSLAFVVGIIVFLKPALLWFSPGSSIEETKRFWVEVVAPEVIANENGVQSRVLRTGDELQEGVTIEVKGGGFANLYFSDGSVARLDSDTRVVVQSASFVKDKNQIVVRLELVAGRVWSRVISFVTPESLWEVKTSHAVAAVRGTAFGVEYIPNREKGVTRVIGAENVVAISLLDPLTKKVFKDDVGKITPNTYVEITGDVVEQVKTDVTRATELVVVREVPVAILNESWIQRSLDEDALLEKKLEEIKPEARRFPEFIEEKTNVDVEEIKTVSPSSIQESPKIQRGEGVIEVLPKDDVVARARNEKRQKDVESILSAVKQNIIDNKGVFCPDGLVDVIPRIPTEIGGNDDGDEYDMARCLVPTYLSSLPFDPDPADTDLHWVNASNYLTGYDIMREGATIGVVAPGAELGEKIGKFEFMESMLSEGAVSARNVKRKKDVAIILDAIQKNSIDGGGVFGGVGAKSCVGVKLPTEIYNIAQAPFGIFPNFDLSCLVPFYIPFQIPTDPAVEHNHFWHSKNDYFTGYQFFVDKGGDVVVFSPLAEGGEKIEVRGK